MKIHRCFPNIYLIGPMGAGKSSVGRKLASLTGLTHVDTDQEVCRRSGVDINWIFEVEGEEGFRKREAALIQELTAQGNMLISTGGGSILYSENREALKNTGIVVYLAVSFEEQYQRTQQRRYTRPLLEGGDFKKNLSRLNLQRAALYLSIAELCYQTDSINTQTLARQIYQDVMKKHQDL